MISETDNVERLNSYVKLNVGGSLFYTTVGTLLRGNTMLSAMFSGRMEVKTDEDGWVLIDRSGKHFGTILNYIRDGSVPLPESKCELEELVIEARYFCLEGLWVACDEALSRIVNHEELQNPVTIIIVKCPNATKSLLKTTRKPVVKLTMNRYNNVFSYTSNSHDNLLRNIECLEKYALMFPATVLFVKDVRDKSEQNEICEWSYYSRGHRLRSIDCIAIHYSSEKRLIKVEFPESRIHEEMLSLLSVASRNLSDSELLEIAMRKANYGSGPNTGPTISYNQLLGSNLSTGQHESDEPETDQSSTSTATTNTSTFRLPNSSRSCRPFVLGVDPSDDVFYRINSGTTTTTSSSNSNSTTITSARSNFASSVRLGKR